MEFTLEILKPYGWLVVCCESKLSNTYKLVEMDGEHPNIETKVLVTGISYDDSLDLEKIVELHNKKFDKTK